jgi:PIF1-like helicase
MLLTTVCSPKSFTDIRIVNSIVYPTFQDACIILGLLEDDKEWIDCFTETVLFSFDKILRMLFIIRLLYGNIIDLFSLWKRFCQNICDDLLYYLQQ